MDAPRQPLFNLEGGVEPESKNECRHRRRRRVAVVCTRTKLRGIYR